MDKLRYALRRRRRPPPREPGVVDPGSIAAKVYGGCMGLPQEVVEHIMDILQDNLRALKACSLTCKSMFASTRHLIYRTLRVTSRANWRILTPEEKKLYAQGGGLDLELRFLSFMAERDLLKYARHLNIRIGSKFFPPHLVPHLQHLQSLDRVHTLTIHLHDAIRWRDVHNTYFTQFYPTLTTLAFHLPSGYYLDLLQFALQFPNLQNLTLDYLRDEAQGRPGMSVPLVVSQSPPLRGHLRCAGLNQINLTWSRESAFNLLNGINFRSIEFQDVHYMQGQQILDGCATSLEELAIHVIGNDPPCLGQLRFWEHTSLRSIILRAPFASLPALAITPLSTSLSIISSPTLSEFVLELGNLPSEFTQPSLCLWGNWDDVDGLFEDFLGWHPDFGLVIRTGRLYNRDEFQAQAKERFPLMARRDCIGFENYLAVDKYRS